VASYCLPFHGFACFHFLCAEKKKKEKEKKSLVQEQ
jgi:hypothetical protein